MDWWETFMAFRRRNKLLFSFIVATALIVFWKGVWGMADVVFDQILFSGEHLFWANLAAALCGLFVLLVSGAALHKLSSAREEFT